MTATTFLPARVSLVMAPGAFRLLLALAVVGSHITGLDVGRLAVLLFFYLSGYWTLQLLARFGSDIRRFYASRYLRIAPLYLLSVAAAILVAGREFDLTSFTLIGAATTPDRDPLGVSWSLDIELQYYLLLPLIAPLMLRGRPLAVVAGSLVVAALGWWGYEHGMVVNVAQYLPPFVLGALTHVHKIRPSAQAAGISLLAFGLMTCLAAATTFLTKSTPDPFHRDIFAFVWMLPLLPYVASSLAAPSSKIDRDLGNISYPLYLIHLPIIFLAVETFGRSPLVRVEAALAAVVVAVLAYRLIDRPVDRWRIATTG